LPPSGGHLPHENPRANLPSRELLLVAAITQFAVFVSGAT
jgi:hypothetical protein